MRAKAALAEAEAIVSEIERKVALEHGGILPPVQPIAAEDVGQSSLAAIFAPKYRGRTIMLSVFNAAQVIGFYGFNSWVPTLLIARGINITHGLEYAFIIAISQPFGPLLGTLFADKIERKTQIIGGLACMGVLMAVFAFVSSPVLLIIIGIAFTLAANVMSYAYHGYQAELFPTRIRSRAVGFVYSWQPARRRLRWPRYWGPAGDRGRSCRSCVYRRSHGGGDRHDRAVRTFYKWPGIGAA